MPNTTSLQKLIAALDLDGLPLEEQEEMLVDLNTVIFKSSLVRMIESMDESARDDFAKLMESEATEQEIETFLTNRVPGAEQAVQDAVESLTNDILAVSNSD